MAVCVSDSAIYQLGYIVLVISCNLRGSVGEKPSPEKKKKLRSGSISPKAEEGLSANSYIDDD